MINLFRFLLQNSSFFLFIVFEFIALYLVVNYNQTQRNIFVNSSHTFSSTFLEQSDQIHDYFNLTKINEGVNKENALLLKKIERLKSQRDNVANATFEFNDAKIISNKINGRYNRFLINRGTSSGITKGMGVSHDNMPVGIIFQVTANYATAISLLNVNFNLSVRILNKRHFGTLAWLPPNPKEASLKHIPAYADVVVGDTVVTSGYSLVFPEGMMVGVVNEVITPTGSNLYDIGISLFADTDQMKYVHVIENINKNELDSLAQNIDF